MKIASALTLAVFMILPLTIRAQSPDPKAGKPATPESFLPKDLKDWVIILGTGVTIAGVLFTSWKALAEWKQATNQRKIEFRHKQAVYAREITKEIFNDRKARAALEMLDWTRRTFQSDTDEPLEIRRTMIQSALRAPQPNAKVRIRLKFSKIEAFIRTRFEALYDRLEELEKLIQLNIVNFEDVETVFRYYMIRIQRPDIQHTDFLAYYDYPNATKFLGRFADTTTPIPLAAPPPEWLGPSELEDDEISSTEPG